MKAWRYISIVLVRSTDVDERSAKCPSCFTPENESPYSMTGRKVGPTVTLDAVEQRNIFALLEIKPQSSSL
jgi:hypothetical protein